MGHAFGTGDESARGAGVCSAANGKDTTVTGALALRLPCLISNGGLKMLMFSRSQLYVGLGLAAVVEIIIRVVVR
jgi:hypothetical protein